MPGKNLRMPIEFPSPCACRYGPEPGAPSHRPVRSSSVRLPLSNMPSKDPGRCLLVRTPGAHRANRLLSFPPAPAADRRSRKISVAGSALVLPVDCSPETTTGANCAFAFRPYPRSARQRNNALAASLRARATAETLFPGCSHSSTMASFSSSVKLRRWARPSRPESVTSSFVKLFSTSDSLAALLALVLICGRALG